ncbi:putative fatty acyl-CoA reductase CG5065 [Culicoides brevitarsis]|uniref:putative fatty acyl-CoA reductase CG5065 n=1 Tax=Culicoides brevitarsis TaxID=469753 RepID=UPI00307B1160
MSESLPSIPEFFAGRQVFLTGGTGFMGKALVEKLLRSCPEIDKIFMLIRPKKGKKPADRVKAFAKDVLFETLLTANPNALQKIVAIEGNVQAVGLGISAEDFALLENVSIVVHASASVRFDDPLREAILTNVRSTYEMIQLSMKLKKLDAFVHISTAFCNADFRKIEEKIYPAHGDWRDVLKLAESSLDDETINILTAKYMDFLPNTYLFTKGLAENICNDFKEKLPIIIYRPAIVTGAEVEPHPGFTDNFNGIMGLAVATGLGIQRSLYCLKDAELFCTPVDTSVRGIISSTWRKVLNEPKNELAIYNCSNGTTSINEIMDICLHFIRYHRPFINFVWTPVEPATACRFYDSICAVFLHFLPAFVVDFLLVNLGNQKPILLKVQRKIRHAQLALRYFITNKWEIVNDNYASLTWSLKECDKKSFETSSAAIYNRNKYIIDQVIFCRRYLLKQSDDTIPEARARFWRFFIIDKLLRLGLILLVIYLMLKHAFNIDLYAKL